MSKPLRVKVKETGEELQVVEASGKYFYKITSASDADLIGKLLHEQDLVFLDTCGPASNTTKPVELNDGSNENTSHYDLPEGATELKHLIWYRNMNAQVGEIFCATYRLGNASHSSTKRDLRKIIAYAQQELERIELYGE